jgi:hypothetical protein
LNCPSGAGKVWINGRDVPIRSAENDAPHCSTVMTRVTLAKPSEGRFLFNFCGGSDRQPPGYV